MTISSSSNKIIFIYFVTPYLVIRQGNCLRSMETKLSKELCLLLIPLDSLETGLCIRLGLSMAAGSAAAAPLNEGLLDVGL